MNTDKNFVPAPPLLTPAPQWMSAPTLEHALIERIRGGGTLDELKEYYRFMREIEHDRAVQAAAIDFVAMQAELPEIPKLGEINIGHGKAQKYMRWDDINRAIKPVLSRHGFGLYFSIIGEGENGLEIEAFLQHKSGLTRSTRKKLPLDKSGSKNIVQAFGSTQSYGQRYAAIALLNLVGTDEDDDAAIDVSNEQILELERLLKLTGRPEQLFCQKFRIETIGRLPASEYDAAVNFLNGYISKEKRDAATKP